jgi:hypothetical protein
LELISKPPHEDEEAGELYKTKEMSVTFVADENPTKVLNPANGAFDAVAPFVAAESAAVLRARLRAVHAMRTDQLNAALEKTRPQGITIGRQVIDQMLGQAVQLPRLQKRFNQRDFVRAGTGDVGAPGQTVMIDQEQKLSAFAALGLADAGTPFFAEQNVPSAMDSVVSKTPARSSWRSRRDQAFSHVPLFVHSRWRRQQVLPDGNRWGMSFQRAPVRSTQQMPLKQVRAGAGGRPPLGDCFGSGNKSAIKDHCSSLSSLGSVVDPAAAPSACQSRDRAISDLLSTSLNTHERPPTFS